MKRVGKQEIKSFELLSKTDPKDQHHCVRMLDNFEDRGLLCIVMEALSSNMRKVVKKFGQGVGINLKAIQIYGKQLLTSLLHLKNNGLIHTDFKLDNILIDDSQQLVKLSDFGSVVERAQARVTNELCPLWYRPPEIFLGLEYSYSLDIWCFGCTIYELATGTVLFQGGNLNFYLFFILYFFYFLFFYFIFFIFIFYFFYFLFFIFINKFLLFIFLFLKFILFFYFLNLFYFLIFNFFFFERNTK